MKKFINTDRLPVIVFLGALIALWEGVTRLGFVEAYILPPPSAVIMQLFADRANLMSHTLVTLHEAALGFISAVFLAIVLALVMDMVPFFKKGFYPILVISQTIPIIVLAPLFAMWFGFGITPKVVIVILVCIFPIVISLSDGLEGVDRDLLNLTRSMGAGRVKRFVHIKIPYALAAMFSGIRISATYAVMGAVIGEWLGGSKGLGVYMMRVKNSFAFDKMFAAILIIVVLSIVLFKFIVVLQGVFMPWTKEDIK